MSTVLKTKWCTFDGEDEESPVIKLPKAKKKVDAFRAGLAEAEGEFNKSHRAPEQQMCLISFILIVKDLLRYGEVRTFTIAERMRATYGAGFCPDSFADSCEAVQKHCLKE